jgi:hypothetical protein
MPYLAIRDVSPAEPWGSSPTPVGGGREPPGPVRLPLSDLALEEG